MGEETRSHLWVMSIFCTRLHPIHLQVLHLQNIFQISSLFSISTAVAIVSTIILTPGLFCSNWSSCLPNPPVASYNTQTDPELLTMVYKAYRFWPLLTSLTLSRHIPPYLPQSSQCVLLLIPQHKTKCVSILVLVLV